VGVDGSVSSRSALRWAATLARAQHARLRPVLAWDAPIPRTDSRSVRLARHAYERLDAFVSESSDDLDGLDVDLVAVRGEAGQVLLAAAAGASLLVLGRTDDRDDPVPAGHGVGRRCVEDAVCPVVVVPHSTAGDRATTVCARHLAVHPATETT
jgi:hypothetical protein